MLSPILPEAHMNRSLRMVVAGALAIPMLVLLPLTAAAAPASATFRVYGGEIAATATRGTFVGKAYGDNGDKAAWQAVVDHEPLSTASPAITGGTLEMATVSPDLATDFVRGTFAGGTITLVDPGHGCTNEIYAVSGVVADVTTKTTSGGSGEFAVTLTHHRTLLFGRCTIYSATVVGTATFTY
jgi:hypothetical protein